MSGVGRLRHRLVLEMPLTTPDGAGGVTLTWSSVATVWANVLAQTGREATQFDRFSGTSTHRVVLRFRSDVSPEMRFRTGQRLLHIVSVRDVEGRRRWLECACEEEFL